MKPSPNNTKLRKSSDRGYVHQAWLKSYHSFSFTGYYDPAYMHYSVLRVINEDVFAAGRGFGMHPHKNMEIITYMLQGELRHADSLGNTAVIKAGDVQCMTAGTGIVHSEINASETNAVHLLQIWIFPERKLLEPSYKDQHFTQAQKQNRWCLIVSHDGRENSLKIHQDISLFTTLLAENKSLDYMLPAHRSLYIQLASGEIEVCGQHLSAGDALMADGSKEFTFKALTQSEILLFDLPIHHSVDIMQQ
ncbi:pirin family protein [Methylotenera sp.]|uniref:pirin family protein n=1 Tax=Methylotenera sp. TaxID=2051956 RepID=UPI002487139E|nr:pirin family protein [Methylotenera sp.]MDI1362133.1 pirin family protein [Methylotenera sp.]